MGLFQFSRYGLGKLSSRYVLNHRAKKWYNINMKLRRDIVVVRDIHDKQDDFVEASPSERVGMVWELTEELWSLRDKGNAERRLQRDVANLVEPRG